MPECIVCGMESDTLYKCKVCGDRFCEECGDVDKKLCLFCLDEEEDEDSLEEDWKEEEKGWR
jgi:hypothetical protein